MKETCLLLDSLPYKDMAHKRYISFHVQRDLTCLGYEPVTQRAKDVDEGHGMIQKIDSKTESTMLRQQSG